MYDELVKRLRSHANSDFQSKCDGCKYSEDYPPCIPCIPDTENAAADAIEEMSRDLDSMNEANIALYGALPKWIPVTERLPDGRDSVLAITGDCDIYVCDCIPSVKQFWTIPGDELHIDDITHWMPLPEPPEEEV